MPIKSITIVGDQTQSLQGTAPEGSTLEVLDLTYASENRLGLDQFQPAGTADAEGKFSLPTTGYKEGDYVRVRAKDKDGQVVNTVTVRIDAKDLDDTYNAPFVGRRITMYDAGNGKAVLTQNDKLRPISEPFAKIQVTNPRTGESTVVQLDADGLFPEETLIGAIAGDVIRFASSDGTNNKDFAVSDAGVWKVVGKIPHDNDVPDPTPLAKATDAKGRPRIGMVQFLGAAYVDGVSEDDIQQRYIGDCYLPAALGSIARLRPDAIEKMLTRLDDGTYACTFQVRKWGGSYEEKTIRLDTDLYVDSSDAVVYGGGNKQEMSVAKMELWFPLIEKAYAELEGGYQQIEGGLPSTVFEAVFGRTSRTLPLDDVGQADALWAMVQRSVDKQLPSALGTDVWNEARYEGTGLHGKHAYSVLGYREVNGVREVEIRNPWGNSEPGDDGNDDGEFWMSVEDVAKNFTDFWGMR